MNLPTDVLAIVKQFQRLHPPATSPRPPGIDDQRRAWTRKVSEQLAFSFGPRYGTKSTNPNHPPSKDSLAFVAADGRLWGFDLVNGSTFIVNDPCRGIDITGQHFIAVRPYDHLSLAPPVTVPVVIPQVPEVPGVPVVPSGTDPQLLKRLDLLAASLADVASLLLSTRRQMFDSTAAFTTGVQALQAQIFELTKDGVRIRF
jgi:hypothetical protein